MITNVIKALRMLQPRRSVLAGFLRYKDEKRKGEYLVKRGSVNDSNGRTYVIGNDGVLRRDPPRVRMSKKQRLKERRHAIIFAALAKTS